MKPVLAILAHESAQPTIDDFLPKWCALDAHLVCYVPKGHAVAGFVDVRQVGESAHAGVKVFRRFVDTLTDLLGSFPSAPYFIVAEYDTVPLKPAFPLMVPGMVMAHCIKIPPHESPDGKPQVCALSPWIMDRQIMTVLRDAGERHIESHSECEHLSGLLDRWIGEVLIYNGIQHNTAPETLGYPWHDGILDRIQRGGFNWIHGLKRKEEFGHLWK